MANISKIYISGNIKVEAFKNLYLKIEDFLSSPDKIGDHLTIFGKNTKDYELKK